jgi:hypothetical protein
MLKSNSRGGFGRRSGTVTVIEEPVRRSAARNAKIILMVVWAVTGLLAATVLDSKWHPVVALLAGALIGLALGLIAAVLIIVWPVLRAIWWWAAEILLALVLVTGWVQLSEHAGLFYRLGAVALVAGVPAVIPQIRRRIVAIVWCVITRHRIRVCFSEFIITNRTGSLPLILWTRPTAVGERIWIWLRPGLALSDIQDRLDLIAVACWGSTATAEAASQSNAAFIRLDIKRRDALTGLIPSRLLSILQPGTPPRVRDEIPLPTALDLPDVTAEEVTPAKPVLVKRPDKKAPASVPAENNGSTAADDLEDWL